MSRSSNASPFRRSVMVVAVFAACSASSAEIVDTGRPIGKRSLAQAESSDKAESASRSVLKCWQEGRLIYESSGVAAAEGAGVAGAAIKGIGGRSLQLLDLRQGLCILERNNG